MYGAIIGDLAGSIYEYDQTKKVTPIKMNNIIENNAFYSDDTILTIAILDAIENHKDYEKYLRLYIKKHMNYRPDFEPYFNSSFSPSIIKWSDGKVKGISKGNGAMMRISSIGYMFDTEKEVIENVKLATIPSHNSKEAIDCASIIALMIFYFKNGMRTEEVFNKLGIIPAYKPFTKFNTTCSETIDNCMYVIYSSNNFEEAISNTLLMGGDTDTNACIVGSIAEAQYGVRDDLIQEVNNKIPKEFIKVLKRSNKY